MKTAEELTRHYTFAETALAKQMQADIEKALADAHASGYRAGLEKAAAIISSEDVNKYITNAAAILAHRDSLPPAPVTNNP